MQAISPAAERNKSFIFAVLNEHLPLQARVLEIASGTGQHAAYISQERNDLFWQCTDQSPEALAAIRSFCQPSERLPEPVLFDIEGDILPFSEPFDALVNINMIHISPWSACLALLQKSEKLLKPGGILYFYGPFLQADRETAPSNVEFDRSLRDRNSTWGLRDRDIVVQEASRHGLSLLWQIDMPANNISLVFRKSMPV